MQSYLDQSYLGESTVQMEPVPPAAVMVPQNQLAGDELIQLPGGLVLSKKTLFVLAAAAGLLLIYLASKNRSNKD